MKLGHLYVFCVIVLSLTDCGSYEGETYEGSGDEFVVEETGSCLELFDEYSELEETSEDPEYHVRAHTVEDEVHNRNTQCFTYYDEVEIPAFGESDGVTARQVTIEPVSAILKGEYEPAEN